MPKYADYSLTILLADKSEQREALSKALGQAFLGSKVAELERSVEDLTFSRGPARRQGVSNTSRGGSTKNAKQSGKVQAKKTPAGPSRLLVLDASVLVHGLPIVKEWVRESNTQIIVPLEVISTLDSEFIPSDHCSQAEPFTVLKKLPPPFIGLAREAVRFLDSQFERNASRSKSSRPHFRPQAAEDQMPWPQVEEHFVPVATSDQAKTVESSASVEESATTEETPEPETAKDTPRFLRALLQCYFQNENAAPNVYFAIAKPNEATERAIAALPPSSISPQPPSRSVPGKPAQPVRKSYSAADRTSGHLADEWARKFGVKELLVEPKEVEEAVQRFKDWQRAQKSKEETPIKSQQQPVRRLFVP